MAQISGLEDLAERRRQLIARSGQLRGQITAEIENLRPVAAWVERGVSLTQSLLSAWPLVAGLGGFLVARKKGSVVGKLSKAWSYWRIGKKLLGLWQRFSSQPPTPQEGA